MKVIYVCNRGGHYSQMLSLQGLISKTESVIISDKPNASKDFGDDVTCYYMEAFNYKKWRLIHFIKNILQSIKIILQFKPSHIITTGAGIAVPVFAVGKLFRCKLIYIETRARVYSKSATGKILGKLADHIIVQWPEMVDVYDGKASYFGTII